MFNPRPRQQDVLDYTGGKMGVAAVPGSGKTRTLSALAAKLIAEGDLRDDQEVLIVTLVNSAVDNFSPSSARFLQDQYGLLPNVGYRVRTLHGLCNDIVRERPSLVALEEGFQIVDEREAAGILADAAQTWARANPDSADRYLDAEMDDEQARLDQARAVGGSGHADRVEPSSSRRKTSSLMPDDVRRNLDRFGIPLPLAEMCHAIYANYQRGLNYRGAVDFQDLIRLALRDARTRRDLSASACASAGATCSKTRRRTAASFRSRFCACWPATRATGCASATPIRRSTRPSPPPARNTCGTSSTSKACSGANCPTPGDPPSRSSTSPTTLIRWTNERHPDPAIRRREPLQPPYIEPTPPGDPQPNPPAELARIALFGRRARARRRNSRRSSDSLAKLAARSSRSDLRRAGAAQQTRLRSRRRAQEPAQRSTTSNCCKAPPRPARRRARSATCCNISADRTKRRCWRRSTKSGGATSATTKPSAARLEHVVKLIRKCPRVEDYLYPQLGRDWLRDDAELAALIGDDPEVGAQLVDFRDLVRRWQEAVLLPIDQLVLILAQDLFKASADLAIAHSIAVVLRQYGDQHPDWRLPNFTEALAEIARNERRFLGVDDDSRGFDPERHKGKVDHHDHAQRQRAWSGIGSTCSRSTATISRRGAERESTCPRRWFVRDGLNLEAEALAQLHASADPLTFDYREGAATQQARLDYVAERLRLLYVGITRARRELIVTWNTGRRGDQQQAIPFVALQAYLEEKNMKQSTLHARGEA